MNDVRIAAICMVACHILLIIPLDIVTIVLGALRPGDCDKEDRIGLNVGQYLLGSGIASLAVSLIYMLMYLMQIYKPKSKFVSYTIILLRFINGLFSISWFIVGAIILYRGNIDCIREESSHVVYALVLWCIGALGIILILVDSITQSKKKDDDGGKNVVVVVNA